MRGQVRRRRQGMLSLSRAREFHKREIRNKRACAALITNIVAGTGYNFFPEERLPATTEITSVPLTAGHPLPGMRWRLTAQSLCSCQLCLGRAVPTMPDVVPYGVDFGLRTRSALPQSTTPRCSCLNLGRTHERAHHFGAPETRTAGSHWFVVFSLPPWAAWRHKASPSVVLVVGGQPADRVLISPL
jgi:hypothetical protein